MYLGEYTLFDILKQNGEEVFQICVITFDIKEPLNHSLTLNNTLVVIYSFSNSFLNRNEFISWKRFFK